MWKSISRRAALAVELLERRDTPSSSLFTHPLTGPAVLPSAQTLAAPPKSNPANIALFIGDPTGGAGMSCYVKPGSLPLLMNLPAAQGSGGPHVPVPGLEGVGAGDPTSGLGLGPYAGPSTPPTPVGPVVVNKDGSKTQNYSDGSKTQTLTSGEVRHQDANGTIMDSTTGVDSNGNPQIVELKKNPGPHGTVTRTTTTTDKKTCKVTVVVETWKWFQDPEGHWEKRVGNGNWTGVHSDPPPQPTAPK